MCGRMRVLIVEGNAELGAVWARSIQRLGVEVLLAGSHTLDEFERWASYLINVQVLYLGYLQEVEARQLIERPAPSFALQYQAEAVERV